MLVTTLVATQQTMQMKFRYRMHVIYVKKKKIQLEIQCIWFIFPSNPFFFCVLTQQDVLQIRTYFDTLRQDIPI